MRRVVVASGNAGKIAEMRAILAGSGFELVGQHELGIVEAEETAPTFIENALAKARHASRAARLPALADDSGLCVDALGGAPGIRSARYAGRHGDSAANIARLLGELEKCGPGSRRAHFHCSIVLLSDPDDPAPLLAEGRWNGSILLAPRGSGGFGYDPVFLPADGDGRSAAELDCASKNRLSHRALALARLLELLAAAH